MRIVFAVAVTASAVSCSRSVPHPAIAPAEPNEKRLVARTYNSGFALAHDTYNGLTAGSDGRIYYVLCSERHDVAGQMYVFDPGNQQIRHVGDLTEASGERNRHVIAQGKSHVNFVEAGGRLYFATHLGYYSIIDGMEKAGVPPAGWGPYQGGHLLAFDMKTGAFEDLGPSPNREGILTMNMDRTRQRIYYLTWPAGRFFRYDLKTKATKDLGAFFLDGENGTGPAYRTICRSLAIDPRDGSVYFTTGEGSIHRYRYETESVELVAGDDLKKDYFGLYDASAPGHMAYNWRQVFWNTTDSRIYGVHGNSGYLFRLDPTSERVELLDRITSTPSRRSGMYDQFSYGYLGFTLGPDQRTIYYLTGAPVYTAGRRVRGKESTAKGESKGIEDLHLITWDIPTGRYTDHGPIFYENGDRPAYVNSIAVGQDGTVYTLARIAAGGTTRTDLVSIPAVLK
ncbi:hypothetical protein [uncultured Paludibaculum sp.]|uniref:hypothetical protein n=1 Tax=uncultured Paludibaculum sp. TaxID=1765020 RepID=UPI002AAC04C8|nr:hypothetical protein [uncultured Paludibaculum sp.]